MNAKSRCCCSVSSRLAPCFPPFPSFHAGTGSPTPFPGTNWHQARSASTSRIPSDDGLTSLTRCPRFGHRRGISKPRLRRVDLLVCCSLVPAAGRHSFCETCVPYFIFTQAILLLLSFLSLLPLHYPSILSAIPVATYCYNYKPTSNPVVSTSIRAADADAPLASVRGLGTKIRDRRRRHLIAIAAKCETISHQPCPSTRSSAIRQVPQSRRVQACVSSAQQKQRQRQLPARLYPLFLHHQLLLALRQTRLALVQAPHTIKRAAAAAAPLRHLPAAPSHLRRATRKYSQGDTVVSRAAASPLRRSLLSRRLEASSGSPGQDRWVSSPSLCRQSLTRLSPLQSTITETCPNPPRQRSQSYLPHSSFLLGAPPSPRVARTALAPNRPRIIRRASSMDNIVANSAANASPFMQPRSPRSKLSAKAFYRALEGHESTVFATAVASDGSQMSGPPSAAPSNKAVTALGYQRSPASSRRSSTNIATVPAQPYTGSPVPNSKLRMKSTNGLRDRRWPTSPPLMSSQRPSDSALLSGAHVQSTTTAMSTRGIESPSSALRLSMLTGGPGSTRRSLGDIDADDDLIITLRGDKAAVQGLEVMLVCIAEGDETVWELRVKRNATSKAKAENTLSAPPSPASARPTTPFTAIYTPPCEDLDMYRADYFSAPVPRSSHMAKGSASSTLAPDMLHSRLSDMQAAQRASRPIVPKATALSDPVQPLARRSRASSHIDRCRPPSSSHAISCPVTPGRSRISTVAIESIEAEDSDSPFDVEAVDEGAQKKGFSNLYKGLAEAYRMAHQDTDDEFELEKEMVCATPARRGLSSNASPSGMVGLSDPTSPTVSLGSVNRSPEHRYALYLPSSSLPCSPSSQSSTGNAGLTTPRDELPESAWNGYSSCIAGSYAALHGFNTPMTPSLAHQGQSAKPEHAFSSPGPFPTTPSLHDLSPSVSPATTLLQRRIGNAKSPGFKLGIPTQLFPDQSTEGEQHIAPLRPLRFGGNLSQTTCEIPKEALSRLGESRGSTGSISLKGRQGWSETETEFSSGEEDESGEDASAEQASISSCITPRVIAFGDGSIAGHP